MMPNRSRVTALVEDEQHKMLIYRYLLQRGLSRHQVTINPSPAGEGSGEQWVRTNYATEVRAHRIRYAKTSRALVVMIDADTDTVDARLMQLDQALRESAVAALRADEPVVRLVPKRNVETWILCLNGQPVEEASDYKRRRSDWSDLIRQASEQLFQWTRPNVVLPGNCVDSLRRGVGEMSRLTV